jgi:hypothetical protein
MTTNIYAKLAKAKSKFGAVIKNKTIQGKYRYADLSQNIEAIQEPLLEQDLDFIQTIENNHLCTFLIDLETGHKEKLVEFEIISGKLHGGANELQEFGAGITYLRRYSLQVAFSLASEDSDGIGAKNPIQKTTIPQKPSIPSTPPTNNASITKSLPANAIRADPTPSNLDRSTITHADSFVSTTTYDSDKSKLETELRNKIISCYKTSYKKTFEPVVQSIDPESKSELMGLGQGASYTMSIPLKKIQHYWNLLEGINNGK